MPTLKLNYTDTGAKEKPALVFLHGFPFDRSTWAREVELCKPNFRVIHYDQRGHGKSDVGNSHYMFEFFVDDILGLLDQLNVEKAILCGLSMGGYMALRFAERNPERVRALILCDTRSEADSDAAKLNRAADLRLIQTEGVSAFADKFLKKVFTPSTYTHQPQIVEQVRKMILANPIEGMQGTLIALATRTDTTASLAKIKVPTLILVGEQDVITPPAAAAAMHEKIEHSVMETIPNAGHLSNLENPQAFDSHLDRFLKQLQA